MKTEARTSRIGGGEELPAALMHEYLNSTDQEKVQKGVAALAAQIANGSQPWHAVSDFLVSE